MGVDRWASEIKEAVIKESTIIVEEQVSSKVNKKHWRLENLKFERKKGFKRTYKCPFYKCHKCFSESGNLRTHLRTHTKSRPFQCADCGKEFITKCHLSSHVLTHTGDRPFECPYEGCDKTYPRSGRLKIHMRSHVRARLEDRQERSPINVSTRDARSRSQREET